MLRSTFFTLILLLSFNAYSDNSAENSAEYALQYIEEYKQIAIREMERSGIPASIKLAQAIHESSWGRGGLATSSNNFFGIKCKEHWTGRKVYHKDDDYDRNGKLMKSCFRAYDSIEESFQDHTNFLLDNSRYAKLFKLGKTDYKSWAKGLKSAGYATDPQYAQKLIRTIEEYHLYELDQTVDMNNLLVQRPNTPVPQDSSVPLEIKEENYIVPAAVRLPDDYVRNSYATSIEASQIQAPIQEVQYEAPQNQVVDYQEPQYQELQYQDESQYQAVDHQEVQFQESQYQEEPQFQEVQYQAESQYQVSDTPSEPAPAVAPDYQPASSTEYNYATEQTTARQAPARMEASRAAIAPPTYRISPQLTNKGGINRTNKRYSQTLQKSRRPRPNTFRRR